MPVSVDSPGKGIACMLEMKNSTPQTYLSGYIDQNVIG